MKKFIKAFSLAELMIVMLILTIILAATMPILSKRAKVKAAAAASSAGAGGQALYLYGDGFYSSVNFYYHTTNVPNVCPSGWSDGGIGVISGQRVENYYSVTGVPTGITIRSCYNPNKTCSSLYLYGDGGYSSVNFYYHTTNEPSACPNGWSDGGVGVISGRRIVNLYSVTSVPTGITVRSCYKCS